MSGPQVASIITISCVLYIISTMIAYKITIKQVAKKNPLFAEYALVEEYVAVFWPITLIFKIVSLPFLAIWKLINKYIK